jgi:hypothetical protein
MEAMRLVLRLTLGVVLPTLTLEQTLAMRAAAAAVAVVVAALADMVLDQEQAAAKQQLGGSLLKPRVLA